MQLVWLIPIVAALIGGWLAIKAVLDRGPTIKIVFPTAEGLDVQKTRVKFRSLDIGRVTDLAFSKDRSRIVATVEMNKQAEPLLVADTRFWVVRPRVTGMQVTGLNTLLSGAYIGMEPGSNKESQREFVGIDVPPFITVDRPGKKFRLHAENLGSLDVGAPIYFRRVQVGSIIAYWLGIDGNGVELQAFINAPYDKYVKADTRFWQASGFDVMLDANGIRLDTESVTSIVLGGIAFQTPTDSTQAPSAAENAEYTLHANRGKAMRLPDTAEETFHVTFGESVRGLSVGAPVDFRGVVVGEVSAIGVDFDATRTEVRIPVEIRLYPDRLRGKEHGKENGRDKTAKPDTLIDKLVERGMRAQLRTGSLLTGQMLVALDYFPAAPKAKVERHNGRAEIPTVAGSIQELQTTLLALARKLDKLPLEDTLADTRKSLNALTSTLGTTEQTLRRIDGEVTPQVQRSLANLDRTLVKLDRLASEEAPVQRDLRDTLREVSRAAESLRSLADFLERNPNALLRGRTEEPEK